MDIMQKQFGTSLLMPLQTPAGSVVSSSWLDWAYVWASVGKCGVLKHTWIHIIIATYIVTVSGEYLSVASYMYIMSSNKSVLMDFIHLQNCCVRYGQIQLHHTYYVHAIVCMHMCMHVFKKCMCHSS